MRFSARDFAVAQLAALKGNQRLSVCIPARDEAATVGAIVEGLRGLVDPVRLVDEIVVVDDGSLDATVEVATRAGATVVAAADVLPELGAATGKGEALWKALQVADGDLIAFVDGDLTDFDPAFVTGLVGPLLTHAEIDLVKATYERDGGGRVTELVARPLLDLLFPHLAHIDQPLGGEFAARRSLLERLPFVQGYGVDLALLVDAAALVGVDAIAQADLGSRRHRNRPLDELAPQARAVMQAAFARSGVAVSGQRPAERPPMAGVAGYRHRAASDARGPRPVGRP